MATLKDYQELCVDSECAFHNACHGVKSEKNLDKVEECRLEWEGIKRKNGW